MREHACDEHQLRSQPSSHLHTSFKKAFPGSSCEPGPWYRATSSAAASLVGSTRLGGTGWPEASSGRGHSNSKLQALAGGLRVGDRGPERPLD